MINETLEADRDYRKDKYEAYERGYAKGKADAEPHWIPVTERLPEKSGEYLVTVKWVTGDCDVDVYEYDARHKTWNDGESAGGERAVAWCELPEPYKGEGRNEML